MITLTLDDMRLAADLGTQRLHSAYTSGRTDAHGLKPSDAWKAHIHGVCGEIVFARHLGLDPAEHLTIDTYKSVPDIGVYEVRANTFGGSHMILRPNDPDDRPYVHVVMGQNPTEWYVGGWIMGADAKRSEWFYTKDNRPKCWWVPRAELNRDFTVSWS